MEDQSLPVVNVSSSMPCSSSTILGGNTLSPTTLIKRRSENAPPFLAAPAESVVFASPKLSVRRYRKSRRGGGSMDDLRGTDNRTDMRSVNDSCDNSADETGDISQAMSQSLTYTAQSTHLATQHRLFGVPLEVLEFVSNEMSRGGSTANAVAESSATESDCAATTSQSELDDPPHLALLDRKWSSLAVTQNIEGLQAMIQDEPAIINRKDFIYGYTALHWGAKLNNIKMVELLLKHHACVDIASNSGITALHLAARHGCSDIVHILIEANANCDVRDCSGKQPKDVASVELTGDAREMLISNLRKTVVLQYGRPLTVDEKVALGLMTRPITIQSDTEPTALGLRGRLRTIAYKKNKPTRAAASQSVLSVVAENKPSKRSASVSPTVSKSLLAVSTLVVDNEQAAKPQAQTLV